MSRQKNRGALTGEVGIAVAILHQAKVDVRKANGHAKDASEFLSSTWAAALLGGVCDTLDINGYDSGDLAELAGAKG